MVEYFSYADAECMKDSHVLDWLAACMKGAHVLFDLVCLFGIH